MTKNTIETFLVPSTESMLEKVEELEVPTHEVIRFFRYLAERLGQFEGHTLPGVMIATEWLDLYGIHARFRGRPNLYEVQSQFDMFVDLICRNSKAGQQAKEMVNHFIRLEATIANEGL